jgi:hypothetical protein
MDKKIKVIENAKINSLETLFYEDKFDVICLHCDILGELGWFKVWYDAEMNDRRYITLNNSIVYLDTLDSL